MSTENKIEWEKLKSLGNGEHLERIAKSLLVIIEEEKKLAEEKMNRAKELLVKMREG